MPSIKPSQLIIIIAMTWVIGGCGTKNDKAIFNSEGGHPSNWKLTHEVTARTNLDSCRECHGDNLEGGIANVACSKCHVNGNPIGAKASGCTSCHSIPPDGTTAPNINASHSTHMELPNVTCAACHFNFGAGHAGHGDGPVNLAFQNNTSFKAKKAVSAPNASASAIGVTCANVSCHGGNPTPAWGGAGPACISCHEQGSSYQVPEYNSYYSGLHAFHLGLHNTNTGTNITCTDCHDDSKLTTQQHFSGLASHTFTSPGKTVGGGNTGIVNYDTVGQTCSGVSASCHTAAPRNAAPWYLFN